MPINRLERAAAVLAEIARGRLLITPQLSTVYRSRIFFKNQLPDGKQMPTRLYRSGQMRLKTQLQNDGVITKYYTPYVQQRYGPFLNFSKEELALIQQAIIDEINKV